MTSAQSIDANPFHWPARRGSAMELVAYSKKNAANSQLIDEAVASVGTGPSPLACIHTHTHTHTHLSGREHVAARHRTSAKHSPARSTASVETETR